jgi:hypothetical protein
MKKTETKGVFTVQRRIDIDEDTFLWQDTYWASLKNAYKGYPAETFREVTIRDPKN